MKQDIRTKTVLIVEDDGWYLSRIEMLTGRVIWSRELSEAWRTRDRNKANAVAEEYVGRLMLFNPIIWEVKAL